MKSATAIFAICAMASIANAENPGVMFVLDGSGSMWGQIEGRAKIEIARELLIALVDDLPSAVNAGLVAYGHRRKGDCEDIEVLAPMEANNRALIKQSIAAINPKGKTPITRALQLAGETLRSVEEETTLVLISDGEETCDGDPCALVGQLIEQGLKVQVHVVGFDVKQHEREQLMCIAKAGNGNYYSADSAEQLSDALAEVKKVVVEQVEKSVPMETAFAAVTADSGKPVAGAVEWTLINSETEQVKVLDNQKAELVIDLKPGPYEVFVSAGSATGEGQFVVTGAPGERFEIPIAVEKKLTPFDSPASAPAGSVINFAWRGPNAKGDLIFIMSPKTANNRYPFSNRHKTAKGPTASLTVPARPGTYEVRYFSSGNGTVLHRMPIKVTAPQVTINSPASIAAGTPMRFTWSGPRSPGDLLFIASPKMEHGKYFMSNNHNASKGKTMSITAPARPGVYEVRYYSMRNGTVLHRQQLEVTAAEVTLDAPRTASAGARITINWSGPKSKGDLIFITKPNLATSKYWTRNHGVSKGSPAVLTVPAEVGTYEIRYYSMSNGRALAKRALIVR